jgi:hypothetical protein
MVILINTGIVAESGAKGNSGLRGSLSESPINAMRKKIDGYSIFYK